MRNLLRPRTFVVAAVAMLLSGGAYAFTASNSVPATTAGNGSGAISGYTVGSVTYTLSQSDTGATDASPVITGVSFTLAPATGSGDTAAPTVVDAVITGTSAHDYSSCSLSATWSTSTGGSYACTGADATVAGATSLAVTASANSTSTL